MAKQIIASSEELLININESVKEVKSEKKISKKLKVTQVSRHYYPFCGGVEAVIKQIADALKEDESIEQEIITCSNGIESGEYEDVNVKRNKYPFEFASNPISFELIKSLSNVDTDILHYHMPLIFAVIAHFIARPKYKKLYVTYHSDIVGYDNIMKPFNFIYHKFLQNADKIHVLSPNIIEKSKILQKYKDKCVVIPYGIEPHSIKYDEDKIKKIKQEYQGKKILFSIGRLVSYKGFEYAIDAMKEVKEDCIYLIAGSGSLNDELQKKINDNNLNKKVKLLGRISDEELHAYYNACDAYLFPSVMPSEAFGIVQLEAMACGKPVINTNLGTGVNFVSLDNETGFTIKPKDVRALVESISKIVSNDELRMKLGTNAKKRCYKFFKIETIKLHYQNFIKCPDIDQKDIIIEDGLCLKSKTGVGSYTLSLSNALEKIGYKPIIKRKSFIENIGNNTVKRIVYYLWLNTVFLFSLCFTKKPITVLFTNYLTPFIKISGVEYISVIHDLCAYIYPNTMTKNQLFYSKLAIKSAVKNSDKIITVSNTVKEEILEIFNYKKSRISVVYNTSILPCIKLDETQKEKIFKDYNINPQNYIISVATLNKRKNIDSLIQAYNKLNVDNFKLLLVGSNGNNRFDVPNGNIIFTGYIDDTTLSILYENAFCFVFPSVYEGFGIPILEAQERGIPVIASDIKIFREIGDNSIYYCKPDYENIRKAIDNILIDHKYMSSNLVKLGKENIKRFSQSIIQQEMIKLMKKNYE